ncbi:hypothetical protein [Bradyrhizobium sp. UFLA05-112]
MEAGDAQSGRYDPAKVIQTRDERGNLVLKDRETGKLISETGDVSADPTEQPPTEGSKYTVGRFEVSEAELEQMLSRQAIDDQRKATLPANADGYKLELPEGTVLPGNQQVQFDANDPGLIAARNWAHARGLDQAAFSEMLSIYASHVATQQATIAEAAQRELAKAGSNATQRVDAVGRWITAEIGHADAKPILSTMVTDAHLRFYERLMHKVTSQGTAPFSQQHRDVSPNTVDDATWSRMSYGEKKAYADRASSGGRR